MTDLVKHIHQTKPLNDSSVLAANKMKLDYQEI